MYRERLTRKTRKKYQGLYGEKQELGIRRRVYRAEADGVVFGAFRGIV